MRSELENLRVRGLRHRLNKRLQIFGVRRASQAGNARRPLTVRDGCGPGLIAAVRQIAMAANNATSALVAVLQ
jgi:hypothetical protein